MACQRSREIDLLAFLAAPRGEEFAEFRLHYPRCAECSAELRAWTELHEALGAAHPEPEQLARYAELPLAQRAAVDAHVRSCPACREELAQLADFDPSRLAEPVSAPREGGLRRWLAGLGRIFWSPAFAYALVVLMLVPVTQRLVRERAQAPLAEALFDAEPLPSAAAPHPPAASAERRDALAEAKPSAPVLEKAQPGKAAADSAAEPAEPRAQAFELARTEPSEAVARLRQPAAAGLAAATAKQAMKAAAAEPRDELLLESWRTAHAPRPQPAGLLYLGIPVGAQQPPGEAWVAVRDAAGARELRQRVTLPAAGKAQRRVSVGLPGSWLEPGAYSVELQSSDAPAARFRFEIE